jgi:hypothetical protein
VQKGPKTAPVGAKWPENSPLWEIFEFFFEFLSFF